MNVIARLWRAVARFSDCFYIERPTLQPSVADFILRDTLTNGTSAIELKSGLIQGLDLGIPAYNDSSNAPRPRTRCTLGPYNCWDFLICRVAKERMIVLSRDEIPRKWFWFTEVQINALRRGCFWFAFKDDATLEAHTIKTTKDEELASSLEKVFLRYKAENHLRARIVLEKPADMLTTAEILSPPMSTKTQQIDSGVIGETRELRGSRSRWSRKLFSAEHQKAFEAQLHAR